MSDSEIKKELLTSFHSQFAENQNHHQTVFIQFISAIIVVILGYVIVYTNTDEYAHLLFVTKDDKHTMTSYAIIHFIGSFLIAENILALVNVLTINIGYGFRRDQMVIYNIRKQYLADSYDEIFGNQSFNPSGKRFLKFLPEFNFIFVVSIFIIQVFVLLSFLYSLSHFASFPHSWRNIVLLLAFAPIFTSLFFYWRYFKKYKKVTQ